MLSDCIGGITAKSDSKLLYISDLDDSFVTQTIDLLSPGPKPDKANKPSAELLKSFKSQTGFEHDLIFMIYGRLKGDPSGSTENEVLRMIELYSEETKSLAEIIQLLVMISKNEVNPQAQASRKVLKMLLDKELLDLLNANLTAASKCHFQVLADTLMNSLTKAVIAVVQFSRPAVSFTDKLITTLMNIGFDNFGPEICDLFLELIDFDNLKEKKDILFSDSAISRITDHLKLFNLSSYAVLQFIWSCFLGTISSIDEKFQTPYYKLHLEIAQKSINAGVFSLLKESPSSSRYFYLYVAFLALFDVSQISSLDLLSFAIADSIEGSPELCEKFWSLEEASKPFMDILIERFPSSCEYAVPLLAALCQTEDGVSRVDGLLNRLPSLTIADSPDPSFVDESSNRGETILVAACNFQIESCGVKIIVPEESQCTYESKALLYKWKIPYSGWDFLARAFNANIRRNQPLLMEILKLFTRVFKTSDVIRGDIEAFLDRVNPIYLESKGRSMTGRVLNAFHDPDIPTDCHIAMINCLLALKESGTSGYMTDALTSLMPIINRSSSRFDCSALDQKMFILYSQLVASWLPLIDEEALKSKMLKSVEIISVKLFNSCGLPIDMKLDTLAVAFEFCEYSKEIEYLVKLNSIDFICEAIRLNSINDIFFDIIEACVDSPFNVKLFGLLNEPRESYNLLDYILVKASFNRTLIVKLLHFLSSVSGSIHERLSLDLKSSEMLSSILSHLEQADVVADFICSLNHQDLPLMKQIFTAGNDLSTRLKSKITSDMNVASIFLRYCLVKMRGSNVEFIEMSKIFPGDVKDIWEISVKATVLAIERDDIETVDVAVQLFSLCLIKTSPDLFVSHLISLLSSSDIFASLCKLLIEDHQLWDSFGNIFAVISSTAFSSLQEKIMTLLIETLSCNSIPIQVLTSLARGCQIFKPRTNTSFVKLVTVLYERFEALSIQGVNVFSDDSAFHVWSNFLLLTGGLELPQAAAAVTILIRLICSHISMKPGFYIPSCMLLLAKLVSDRRHGSTTVQFCNFYHLSEKIQKELFNTKSLLPAFLLNESFVNMFLENDGLNALCQALLNTPTDECLWKALLMLGKFPKVAPLLLHHVKFKKLLSPRNAGDLVNFLLVVVPAKVDPHDLDETFALQLVDLAWSILSLPNLGSNHVEEALQLISLIAAPLVGIKSPLGQEVKRLNIDNGGRLEAFTSSQNLRCQELALALKETINS